METLNDCKEPFVKGMNNRSYGQSKLAQVLWVKELTRRVGKSPNTILVNAFHPGAVDTDIWEKALDKARPPNFVRTFFEWLQTNVMWTSEEGALTGLYLAVETDRMVKENIRGKLFFPQSQEVTNPLAEDVQLQHDLWEFTETLVKDFLPPKQD